MDGQPESVRQVVLAEAGYAYGVIGADLHVVPGRGPAYLLTNYAPPQPDRTPVLDGGGLPARPSYLLNARSAVVEFVGRRGEVRDLTAWRDSDHRVAVRWLHGPGGQGKTRLAGHLADNSVRGGWKVIVADPTAGKVDARNPTSQDLRIGAATGLLMVVDYADRWPLAHLTWLFSNKVLNQDVPVRVLLVARTSHVWPALCHALVQAGWPPDSCSTQQLGPLPSAENSRRRMFTAARDSFARRYRLSDPRVVGVPEGLERDEFGLTLAVHMAALVAVDRHARSAAQPPLADMTGLTAYLLDRERHHWHTLYDTGTSRDTAGGRAAFDTVPERMSRAVFTAALTGPLGHRDAKAALDAVGVGTDADRVLADHTFCYPPTDPRTVLEPLSPDRLAEDFLALCLPGHHVPGAWAGAWADGAPELLLTPATAGGPLPPYAPRAITFLAAASDRWPHLIPTLAALEPLLPDDIGGTLVVAAADLAERLANHRLATTTDPAERARLHYDLGQRLDSADRHEKAVAAFQEAVRLYRPLAEADPLTYGPNLAIALVSSATPLIGTAHFGDWLTHEMNRKARGYRWVPPQRQDEAMTALGEALEIYRRLARDAPAQYEHDYVGEEDISTLLESMTSSLDGLLAGVSEIVAGASMITERWQEARAHVSARVARLRSTARNDPAALVTGLDDYVFVLLNLDLPDEALPAAEEALRIARRLARDDPGEHEAGLLSTLLSYARVLHTLERHGESSHAMREAVRIARRRVHVDSAEHTNGLRSTLEAHVQLLSDQHRWEEALPAAEEAVQLARRLAHDDPDTHLASLAGNLSHLANVLLHLHRREEETSALEEAIPIRRRLAQDDPALHEHMLFAQLCLLSTALAETRRWNEALNAGVEAVEILSRVNRDGQYGVEAYLTAAAGSLVHQSADGEWHNQRPEGEPGAGLDGGFAPLVEHFLATAASHERGACPGLTAAIEEHRRHFARRNPAGQLYRQLTGADPLSAERHLSAAARRPDAAHEEVVASLRHAVAVRREQVKLDSGHLRDLAAGLGAYALTLRSLGRQEEALSPVCEATEIYCRLARNDPRTYEPMRVEAWVRAAVIMEELGIPSASALEEAVESRRRLARHDHAGHAPALAAELAIMARTLAKQGRWAEAVASATESFEIRRRLGEPGLTSIDDSVSAAEEFLTTHLAEAELRTEHLAALRDAVTAHRAGDDHPASPRTRAASSGPDSVSAW